MGDDREFEASKPADIKTAASVRAAFFANYRLATSSWVGGENEIQVVVADIPHAVSRSETVWHRKHAWKGTNLSVEIAVSRSWRRTVQARGLTVVDGLLTTHARRLKSDGEVVVYKASWIRQGRGLAVRAESGYLAHHPPSSTSYHCVGETARRAAAGLRRKLLSQAIPQGERDERTRRRREARRASLERMVRRLQEHELDDLGGVVVHREDSLRARNCEPGTDAFIDAFFPDRSSATIAEIALAVCGQDLDPGKLTGERLVLARQIGAACLAAIRRVRRERRGDRARPSTSHQ